MIVGVFFSSNYCLPLETCNYGIKLTKRCDKQTKFICNRYKLRFNTIHNWLIVTVNSLSVFFFDDQLFCIICSFLMIVLVSHSCIDINCTRSMWSPNKNVSTNNKQPSWKWRRYTGFNVHYLALKLQKKKKSKSNMSTNKCYNKK